MAKIKTKMNQTLVAVILFLIAGLIVTEHLNKVGPNKVIYYEVCGLDTVECPNEVSIIQKEEGPREIIKAEAIYMRVDNTMMQSVTRCESEYILSSYNPDDPKGGAHGLYQIILPWHPEVSLDCAYDARCSARYFAKRQKEGDGHLWTCYGKWLKQNQV